MKKIAGVIIASLILAIPLYAVFYYTMGRDATKALGFTITALIGSLVVEWLRPFITRLTTKNKP
jgi:hypothetical protein